MAQSRSKVERLIWALALTAASAYTVYEVYETFKYYQTEPTVSKIRMKTELPMNLSALKLCLEYHLWDLKPFNDNWTVYNKTDLFRYLNSLNMTNLQFEKVESEKLLEATAKQLNIGKNQLFFIASSLVSMITESELHQTDQATCFNATYYFLKIFPQALLNASGLVREIGAQLWAQMQLSIVNFQGKAEGKKMANFSGNLVTWHGSESVLQKTQSCFNVTSDLLSFGSIYDSIQITFNPSEVFLPIPLSIRLHFGHNYEIVLDSENVIMVDTLYKSQVAVTVDAQYNARSSRNYQCSNELISASECVKICTIKLIYSLFDCVPLHSVFVLENNLMICWQMEGFHNIIKPALLNHLKNECSKRCHPPCKRRRLIFEKHIGDQLLNISMLNINIASFIFPVFEDVSAMTSKQLLSQLGGNLSLWLGASFLVLLHVLIFIIYLPIDYYKNRKKTLICIGL